LEGPPNTLAVTHWSTRLLARHFGVSDATVARAWCTYRVQPWRRDTVKFSTDQEPEAKVRDLFAALEIATGQVTDRCYDRHGKAEFLDFLKLVARTYPRRELHIVLDNYHTHKHDEINQWLAKHPGSACTSRRPQGLG
jgi:hypothetical protein